MYENFNIKINVINIIIIQIREFLLSVSDPYFFVNETIFGNNVVRLKKEFFSIFAVHFQVHWNY